MTNVIPLPRRALPDDAMYRAQCEVAGVPVDAQAKALLLSGQRYSSAGLAWSAADQLSEITGASWEVLHRPVRGQRAMPFVVAEKETA